MQNRKSPYCTSAIGRIPATALPMAIPARAISEMGVSRTRSCPNSSARPRVTVNAPPKPPSIPMSSPMQKTRSSRRISSRIANFNASAIVIFVMFYSLKTSMNSSSGLGSGLASAKTRASSNSFSTPCSIAANSFSLAFCSLINQAR